LLNSAEKTEMPEGVVRRDMYHRESPIQGRRCIAATRGPELHPTS
jgi:hypothetical protein